MRMEVSLVETHAGVKCVKVPESHAYMSTPKSPTYYKGIVNHLDSGTTAKNTLYKTSMEFMGFIYIDFVKDFVANNKMRSIMKARRLFIRSGGSKK